MLSWARGAENTAQIRWGCIREDFEAFIESDLKV